VRHRDGQHRLPSGASGREGHRVRVRDPRASTNAVHRQRDTARHAADLY
jgi:hypothetical protein